MPCRNGRRSFIPSSLASATALLAGGCVTVKAPEKPIVIELNVNIRQEVIYRLAADAKNTVENNQDIF
ncbi:MAG: YnbE family lipoprotein [Altererythrobacter sp.]|nr:YnbE family lipoprotein [Altererythrobacter sp.]